MTSTSTTVIGNLTADPELRHLPSGAPAVAFTIATNERRFDPDTRRFYDGPTVYLRCHLIGPGADNAAGGMRRGTRVIAQGTLAQRSYTDRHGTNHVVSELHVQEIGPTLRYSRVQITPAARTDDDASDQATAEHHTSPRAEFPAYGNADMPIDSDQDAAAVVDLDTDADNDTARVSDAHR